MHLRVYKENKETKMTSPLKLADSVLHRFVQIIQEAMLTGTDCADHMRMVRLVPDSTDPNVLVLSDEYKTQVEQIHQKYLAEVESLKAQQSAGDA